MYTILQTFYEKVQIFFHLLFETFTMRTPPEEYDELPNEYELYDETLNFG